MDISFKLTGQDSGTSLVSECVMSSGHQLDIDRTGGLDRIVHGTSLNCQ